MESWSFAFYKAFLCSRRVIRCKEHTLGHAFLASKLRPDLSVLLRKSVLKAKLNLMYLQNGDKRVETTDSKSLPTSILRH